ncbi:MAG: hypothetical protein ABIJ09_20285 [Pseudomonadota bacterium]
MTRIVDRSTFTGSTMANKQIDVAKLKNDGEIRQAAADGLSSADKLATADLNGDGKIAGTAEMNRLFSEMDRLDDRRVGWGDGSGNSFKAEDGGQKSPAGRVHDRLAMLAENRQVASTGSTGGASRPSFGQRLAEEGRTSLTERTERHNRLVEERGVGTYFGDHSSYHSLSQTEKAAYLKEHTKPGQTAPTPNQLKQTSCVDWALESVVEAYKKAGKPERGEEIKRIVGREGGYGGVLCRELQKDGWKSMFFAHDAKKPDMEGGSRRDHAAYVNMAKQGKFWVKYPSETMKVDGFIQNYRPSDDSSTPKDMSGIDALKKVPFAIGVAKGGMHCFAMQDGTVNENHWNAGPDDGGEHMFQRTPLEDWGWSTGLIMVPPGTWPTE